MSEIKENDFCRIIRSKSGNQVLIMKNYDEEKEKDSIVITVPLPGTEGVHVKGTISAVFDSEQERDEAFVQLTEDSATDLENEVLSAYSSLFDKSDSEEEEV